MISILLRVISLLPSMVIGISFTLLISNLRDPRQPPSPHV